MRELPAPIEIHGDENATEMVRFWLAHGEPHVALLLGMHEDSGDEVGADEIGLWGEYLE